jgi:probable addiction module antidote protein
MLKTKTKSKIKLSKFDAADYIKTREDIDACITVALEENDPQFFAESIGNIIRSAGMAKITNELNLPHESLTKSLSADGNPSFETIMRVLDILGYKFSVENKKTA